MIVDDILKKRELCTLDRNYVDKELVEYLQKNNIKEIPDERSSKYRDIVKGLRKRLHRIYGVYKTKRSFGIEFLLNDIASRRDICKASTEILKSHTSSLERLNAYEKIYFRILKGAESVCDLGCGMNPFSFIFMPHSVKRYFASDFNSFEIELVKRYFGILKKYYDFDGEARVIDLRYLNFEIPECDVCLLFKILDDVESRGHKHAEELIKRIPCRKIVVSFPTRTLSQRRMRNIKRKWFEMMCLRLGHFVDSFEIGNELFYVVEKDRV